MDRAVLVSGNLRSNNGDVLVNAAIEGLGVLHEPTFLAYEALRQNRLIGVRKFLPAKAPGIKIPDSILLPPTR